VNVRTAILIALLPQFIAGVAPALTVAATAAGSASPATVAAPAAPAAPAPTSVAAPAASTAPAGDAAVSGSAASPAVSAATSLPEILLVKVNGGCFRMGDIFNAGGADEKPVHEACVKEFSIGKFPVTQDQWTSVMGNNPSEYRGDGNLPVEGISWNDAQAFIKALRQKTGKNWRLPTEAEWEYAARSGGKERKYPLAGKDEELGEYAWLESNSGLKPHPTGTKKPNELGLYDMAGNVWQWVQDRYDPDYYRQSPRNNPKGDPFGVNRVLKGGSAYTGAYQLRIAYRDYQSPDSHGNCVGLRLAISAE
jgi:formylglycine-generating enzyme required for sulfatase activity